MDISMDTDIAENNMGNKNVKFKIYYSWRAPEMSGNAFERKSVGGGWIVSASCKGWETVL